MRPHDEAAILHLRGALKLAIDAVDAIDLYNGVAVRESRLNQELLAELRKAEKDE